jgi:hypothetical protein
MSMEQIREIGMRLQRGGVGYYSRENFVHLDVGNVRYWPRMGYDQLARVFPDGKSVDLASDGRALPRYEEARLEISSRGGIASDVPQPPGGGLFGWLFGNHDREEEAVAAAEVAPAHGPTQIAALDRASSSNAPPAHMTAADRRAAAAAAPALAAIDASNAPETTPAPSTNRTQVAALAPAAAAAATQDADAAPTADADADAKAPVNDKAVVASLAPMPPARPVDLVAYADVPTPPSRPSELIHLASLTPQVAADAAAAAAPSPKTDVVKADPAETDSAETDPAKAAPLTTDATRIDPASRLARAASLPVVITQGPKDQRILPPTALGYAAVPGASANEGAAQIVSARLDRSNYSELTSATPTAEAPSASILGQAFTGLRQAAHAVPDALSAMPSASYKIAFNAAAGLLDCAHFTKGAAASAPPASPNGVSISEATAPPN